MRKIKILHLIKSLGRGGAEMLLPETLRLHNQEKFQFHYAYFLPWKDQMVNDLSRQGAEVKCFRANNNLTLLLKVKELIDYCKKNEINIIHCHLPWAGFAGRLIYQLTKIPVIYTEHNLQERYHPLTKFINRLSFNNQTLALGVSEDVTQSIIENIAPSIPVYTLLNGVNTEKYRRTNEVTVREKYNIPKDAIVIGNVAVFRFQKRLIEWLRIMKSLTNKHANIYGILVGSGPLEDDVKEEWQRLNLEEKVLLPGLETNPIPYYDAMDIFMMSSSFEGLPIALLEAMSMECAVVSTDAGGIKEVVRTGEDGLLCEVENWEELNLLVERLIQDKDTLIKFKTQARNRVVSSFSLVNMVEKLENYYLDYHIEKN